MYSMHCIIQLILAQKSLKPPCALLYVECNSFKSILVSLSSTSLQTNLLPKICLASPSSSSSKECIDYINNENGRLSPLFVKYIGSHL